MIAAALRSLAASFEAEPLSRDLGLRCLGLEDGRATVVIRPAGRQRHRTGAMPGVLVGAAATEAALLARRTRRPAAAPAGISVRFLRPSLGDELVARAVVVTGGEGELVRVEVSGAGGLPAAVATVRW